MKHGIKKLQRLCYKLWMMEILLTGHSFIIADNKLQVSNSTRPESTLNKKCISICYHTVWDPVVIGELLITHIRTGENLPNSWQWWLAVVNAINLLVTSFMISTMIILNNKTRPANHDQLILAHRLCSSRIWPSGRSIQIVSFVASGSQESYKPGRSHVPWCQAHVLSVLTKITFLSPATPSTSLIL